MPETSAGTLPGPQPAPEPPALRHWREQLAAWAIPAHILAAAPESPWVLPAQVFLRRADRQLTESSGESHAVAMEALAGSGSVLDIGAAAGAASLPLGPAITEVTAVDERAELLAEFAARATALSLPHRLVPGRWPEVAGQVPPADVVVCGHVLYNVAELAPFVAELTGHARRLVVAELAESHPLTSLNELWRHFHGIERPAGPTAADAVAALAELGVRPVVRRWRKAARPEYRHFTELVEVTRRRLCLPASADPEVAEALRGLGVDPGAPPDLGSSGRSVVTLSWPGSAD